MATSSPPNGSLIRLIVPIVLFVVIVGAVAWVSQNLPRGQSKKVDPPPPGPDKPSDLRFFNKKSIWNANDPEYLKEFESGVEGFYDFPFFNPTPSPITLGFAFASCDCSVLKVAVIEPVDATSIADRHAANPTAFPIDPAWNWTKLKVSEKDGVQIPAGGGGVARVQWDGRKSGKLFLRLKVWMHPTDKPEDRSFETLGVAFIAGDPVHFQPMRVSLGVIVVGGQERGKAYAYSTTRKDLNLKVDAAKDDPLFDVKFVKLDAAGIKALEAELPEDKKNARIQSATRIETTVHTQKDGKLLDLGHFSRALPIVLDDFAQNAPTITGYIRGDIDIGTTDDGGKVNLRNFSATEGVQRAVPLWTDGAADLELESVYPTTIAVKLTRNAKESTPARSRWTLDVAVPPGAGYGAFSDDAVIILRSNSMPPRRIRIPVVGTAGQG